MYLFYAEAGISTFPFLRKYIIQVNNQSDIVNVAAQSHECKSSILLAMRTVKGKMIYHLSPEPPTCYSIDTIF
jgi:hypothetical protein